MWTGKLNHMQNRMNTTTTTTQKKYGVTNDEAEDVFYQNLNFMGKWTFYPPASSLWPGVGRRLFCIYLLVLYEVTPQPHPHIQKCIS
jgi:hypothetical protein